jgi:hypothetical protein
MTTEPRGGETQPSEAELTPRKVDLPDEPLAPDEPIPTRGNEDHRPSDYRIPQGPFRPIKDIGEATTVEEPENAPDLTKH